jgi:hypothetical protein
VPYKRFLAHVVRESGIRFVLDIHGAAARRDFGIALGTMGDRSCPGRRAVIVAGLAQGGFRDGGRGLERLDIDSTFKGNGRRGQETITRYVWESLATPAVQLELNERLRVAWRRPDASIERPFRARPEHLEKTIRALVGVVEAINDIP